MKYEAVIGLEVHIQVRTETKMFCTCKNEYGSEPNTNVCPVCLGYPGVLPVMNQEAIRKTAMAGLMCDCTIGQYNKFDRKHYFYPDMPKNYQITQYDYPICLGGGIHIFGKGFSGAPIQEKTLGLTRIHLEEDVAKSTHFGKFSAIDYNRAGVPLMECVSEPDMRSADEAYAFLTGLRQIMQYAGVSDCDMEKGQMRCDVNISVRPEGQEKFGTKLEIKNLNSLRAIHRSIDYEIERQIDVVEEGGTLKQATLRWDDDAGVTSVMRLKEDAHDYRYFPEPDLMPLNLSDEWLENLKKQIPETPQKRCARFITDYKITDYDASVLTAEKALADYFETAAKSCKNPKSIANWIITNLLATLSETDQTIDQCPVKADHLSELINLIEDNTISGKISKTDVFPVMLETGKAPSAIVEEKGLKQVTDTSAIEAFVDQAIAANPDPVADYQSGNPKAIQFLVGQVMKLSRGKAYPQLAVQLLKSKL